jgi:hypothetical protein
MPAPKGGNSKSFKKGNVAALGNTKELRLSTQLDLLLKKANKRAGYEEQFSNAQALAEKVFNVAMNTEDPKTMLDYFKEIADRTEGRPKTSVDHTTLGEKMVIPILGGLSTQEKEKK